MPDRINAAHRLDQILREVQTLPNNISTVEAWTQVFRIDNRDTPTTAVEVARMVGLLRGQLDEVHRKMGDTDVRPQRYEGAVNQISDALDVQNLTAPWGSFQQYLRPEVLDTVGWCADTLPEEEDVIEPEDLTRFRDEVREFGERIAGSDLPDYVKAFVAEQVSIIEQAIREYPITGANAFRHGSVESFFGVVENRETFLERQDEPEMQTLRKFLAQMQMFAEKAGPWIAIGRAAATALGLPGGDSP